MCLVFPFRLLLLDTGGEAEGDDMSFVAARVLRAGVGDVVSPLIVRLLRADLGSSGSGDDSIVWSASSALLSG